jgi:hypothetical protein
MADDILTAEYVADKPQEAELWLRFANEARPDIGLNRTQARALMIWLTAAMTIVDTHGSKAPVMTIELDGVTEAVKKVLAAA